MAALAEAALRDELARADRDDEEIAGLVALIRADPNAHAHLQNDPVERKRLRGAFANAILTEAAAIVPFVPPAPPVSPAPPQQQAPIVVDLVRLQDHKHFRPLGPPVKPDAPAEHAFSHLKIDHTMSGFVVGSQEEKAVRLIYDHLMYESKPSPPCKEIPASHTPGAEGTRGPFFTAREHDHKPPSSKGSHKEILIYGSTQLSKTPEAAASAWAACFIDGCVPIIGGTRCPRPSSPPFYSAPHARPFPFISFMCDSPQQGRRRDRLERHGGRHLEAQ